MVSLLITLLAGLFFVIGVIIALNTKKNNNLINFSIGMSFSVLIILILVDILPECLELFTNNKYMTIFGGILVGIGILLILERIVPNHHHHDKKGHHHDMMHIGIMTSLTLILHNFIEGMGIYGVAQNSIKAGLIYAVGVGMHNIPFGIKVTAVLKENRKKMWISIILLTLSTFLGGLFIYIFKSSLSDYVTGSILSITIGMIIYLLFAELFVELKSHFDKYSLFGLLIGIVLMLVSVLI